MTCTGTPKVKTDKKDYLCIRQSETRTKFYTYVYIERNFSIKIILEDINYQILYIVSY